MVVDDVLKTCLATFQCMEHGVCKLASERESMVWSLYQPIDPDFFVLVKVCLACSNDLA